MQPERPSDPGSGATEAKPAPAGELRGSPRQWPATAPTSRGSGADLDSRQTATVFDGMDWDGVAWRAEAGGPPPPSLRQPASAYFADFPWGD